MQISDARLEQHGSKNLEVGFVFFFDQFRRIYIGEQVNRPSNVSQKASFLCVVFTYLECAVTFVLTVASPNETDSPAWPESDD